MADLNKLLVPTPPVYEEDSLGRSILGPNGNWVIQYGRDPDVSVPRGIFQSFFDAPGVPREDGTRSVLREELREITLGGGLEYRFMDMLALRTGYFYQHESKGGMQYYTMGIGAKYKLFSCDFSCWLPNRNKSAHLRIFRFTVSVELG
jgi:hypothetical protein